MCSILDNRFLDKKILAQVVTVTCAYPPFIYLFSILEWEGECHLKGIYACGPHMT